LTLTVFARTSRFRRLRFASRLSLSTGLTFGGRSAFARAFFSALMAIMHSLQRDCSE
jgi:hypothetical protein